MRWIRTIAGELYALFVDDGRFALAILAWVVLVSLLVRGFATAAWALGPLLFAGLASILAASAVGRATRSTHDRGG